MRHARQFLWNGSSGFIFKWLHLFTNLYIFSLLIKIFPRKQHWSVMKSIIGPPLADGSFLVCRFPLRGKVVCFFLRSLKQLAETAHREGRLGLFQGQGGISAETFCSRGRGSRKGAPGRRNSPRKGPDVGRWLPIRGTEGRYNRGCEQQGGGAAQNVLKEHTGSDHQGHYPVIPTGMRWHSFTQGIQTVIHMQGKVGSCDVNHTCKVNFR